MVFLPAERPVLNTSCTACGGVFWWRASGSAAWKCWACDPPQDAADWQLARIEIANSRMKRNVA